MQSFQNSTRTLIFTLIFLFPLLGLHIDHWASYIYTLLTLTFFLLWRSPEHRSLLPNEKYLMLIIGFLILTFIFNYYIIDSSTFNYSRLRRYSRLLPALAIICVVSRSKPKEALLWYSVTLAAILAGALGIIEFESSSYPRIKGDTNPLVYGWISACLSLFCLSSWPYFRNKKIWLRALPFLGFVMALIACVLSGARGAWIAVILSGALLVLMNWRHIKRQYKIFIVSGVIVFCASIYSIPQFGVKNRLNLAYQETISYLKDGDNRSSIGVRLELWKLAFEIFSDYPILGAGANEFKTRVEERVASGEYSKLYRILSEPHQEYLTAMANRGIIGLVSILLLLGYPLIYFYKHSRSSNRKARRLAQTGVVLIVCYATFGFTACALDIWLSLSFFSFYLAVLTALLGNEVAPDTSQINN